MEPPHEESIKDHGRRDSRLSLENRTANTIKSRKVAILAENGYKHSQLTEVKKALEKEEAAAVIISATSYNLKSADGNQEVEVDKAFVTTASVLFDAVFVPGGRERDRKSVV